MEEELLTIANIQDVLARHDINVDQAANCLSEILGLVRPKINFEDKEFIERLEV